MKYRKRKGKDTWHFCTNCSNWPTSDYDERDGKPTYGEFCNECLAKNTNGTCSKKQSRDLMASSNRRLRRESNRRCGFFALAKASKASQLGGVFNK